MQWGSCNLKLEYVKSYKTPGKLWRHVTSNVDDVSGDQFQQSYDEIGCQVISSASFT